MHSKCTIPSNINYLVLFFFAITYSTALSVRSLRFPPSWKPPRMCKDRVSTGHPGDLPLGSTWPGHWAHYMETAPEVKRSIPPLLENKQEIIFDLSFALGAFCLYNQCRLFLYFSPRRMHKETTRWAPTIKHSSGNRSSRAWGFLLGRWEKKMIFWQIWPCSITVLSHLKRLQTAAFATLSHKP